MVPLLHELERRGHDVEVVVPAAFGPFVERGGLRASGVGPSWTEMDIERVQPGWHALDGAGQLRVWTEVATRLYPHLLHHVEQARPDVIIHDQYELAAWLVAERLGIPSVPYAMTLRALEPQVIALCGLEDAFAKMRESAGLDPGAGVAAAGSWLYLDAMPPSLSSRFLSTSPTVRHVHHVADDCTGSMSTAPMTGRSSRSRTRPLVYVTTGTVFNRQEGVLERLVSGAASVDDDIEVIVTLGHNGAPLIDVPTNVTVHRYLPQSELYGALSAVVCHGGFGTTFGAIGHGIPVACAPMGADQPVNAALVAGAGAGFNLAAATGDTSALFPSLAPGAPDPDVVAAAVGVLLGDASFAENAEALAVEMATGLPPAGAAALIEEVVTSGTPLQRPDTARHGGL